MVALGKNIKWGRRRKFWGRKSRFKNKIGVGKNIKFILYTPQPLNLEPRWRTRRMPNIWPGWQLNPYPTSISKGAFFLLCS